MNAPDHRAHRVSVALAAITVALGASSFAATARERSPAVAQRVTDADESVAAMRGVRAAESRTVELLLQDAETAYRGGRWSVASDAFKAVLAMAPDHPQAWFRTGNLHHRRSQWLPAASAYRKAADRADGDPSHAGVRVRALLNLAAVNVELANQALAQAQSEPHDETMLVDREAIERDLLQHLHRIRARHGEAVGAAQVTSSAPARFAEPMPWAHEVPNAAATLDPPAPSSQATSAPVRRPAVRTRASAEPPGPAVRARTSAEPPGGATQP